MLECYLNATGLKSLPQDLLEKGDMIGVHQSMVFTWYVDEGAAALAAFQVTTAEASPGLELLVQPVGLCSPTGDGVEYIQDL